MLFQFPIISASLFTVVNIQMGKFFHESIRPILLFGYSKFLENCVALSALLLSDAVHGDV